MKNIIPKIVTAIIATFMLSFSSLQPVLADNGENVEDCRYFLGMVSWDCNTGFTNGQEMNTDQLTEGIWMIVFNVLSDISVIATYLALGYVIYGGYQYIFSSGDPSKVVVGKRTLVQAFTGLAIVMSASVILNAIRIALGANFTTNCTLSTGGCYTHDNANAMIDSLINWIIAVSGIVAACFIVYGGIAYMTSNGEPNKLQKAKNIILYALIGLVIVALAKIITSFAFSIINQANESSYINTTLIKELNEK